MILYFFITYLVMLGALIENNESIDSITTKEWGYLLLSPIVLPIFIGFLITKNK